MREIRVLVADDRALFRDGVRAPLAASSDIEVVGEAATGDGAVTQALALEPDVALMDINMPMHGLASCHVAVLQGDFVANQSTLIRLMRGATALS